MALVKEFEALTKIRLTEKEILALDKKEEPSYYRGACDGAQAQLKKFVEWGDEECYDHNGAQRKEQGWCVKRRECPICWQSLLEE